MVKYFSNVRSKWLNILLIILVIFLIKMFNQNVTENISENTNITLIPIDSVKKIFPNATKILPKKDEDCVYEVYSENKLIGSLLYSNSDSIKGYGGEVPLIIGVDNNNIIKKIVILENNETPAFLERVKREGLLAKWENLSLEKARTLKVDVISGATFSSNAIIKNINKLLGTTNLDNMAHGSKIKFFKYTILLSFLLIMALIAFFTNYFKKFRVYLLLLNVILFGFLTGTFLSIYIFKSWLMEGIDFFTFPIIYIIALLSILIPLFTNKSFYCVYICPYGASQELVGKIGGKFFEKRVIPSLVQKFAMFYLLLIVVCLVCFNKFDVSQFEPFTAFLVKSSSIASIVIAVFFLVLSLFCQRPWCKLCPTGKVLELFRTPLKIGGSFKKN